MLTEFEEYKLIHNFYYPNESLNSWINETNFSNHFKDSWDSLHEVLDKVKELGHYWSINTDFSEIDGFAKYSNNQKENTYKCIIDFIEYYNANER